jgi:hypothetical protein
MDFGSEGKGIMVSRYEVERKLNKFLCTRTSADT